MTPVSAAAPLLRTTQLTVKVGERVLVAALDLVVQPGQFWCLLGPNGAGKTLLLHTLAGARAPGQGAVAVAGRALAEWPPAALARQRGLLPQQLHDAFSASVLDVVLQGRHPHLARWAWEGEAEQALARQALARVGLAGFEARDVLTLSGGERQRVALATLLVQDPPLVLLDEPLAHLDLAHQLEVAALLAAEVHERGRAVVMSVHDLSLAQRVGTHALLLGQGEAWAGPIDAVMREDTLSRVFAHALQRHLIDGRVWWLPT
ncbi:MAG: ABC transporter ATP-binding protein [Burkholderiales bacterium]